MKNAHLLGLHMAAATDQRRARRRRAFWIAFAAVAGVGALINIAYIMGRLG